MVRETGKKAAAFSLATKARRTHAHAHAHTHVHTHTHVGGAVFAFSLTAVKNEQRENKQDLANVKEKTLPSMKKLYTELSELATKARRTHAHAHAHTHVHTHVCTR